MRWCHFYGKVTSLLASGGPPDLIIIHLGGNDLANLRLGAINRAMYRTLQLLMGLCPHSTVALSGILPRAGYRGARCNTAIDKCRRACNRRARKLVERVGGFYVPHPQFSYKTTHLYLPDGVHLSELGNARFIGNLAQAIYAWLANSR